MDVDIAQELYCHQSIDCALVMDINSQDVLASVNSDILDFSWDKSLQRNGNRLSIKAVEVVGGCVRHKKNSVRRRPSLWHDGRLT